MSSLERGAASRASGGPSTRGEQPLASTLLEALGVSDAATSAEPRLELALVTELETARSYWSGLEVPEHDVVRHVAKHLSIEDGDSPETLEALLGEVFFVDLYLCCGLAKGHAAALACFEEAFGDEISVAVGRIDTSGDLRNEVRQVLRDKLFVSAPGSEPGIVGYSGRGPLGRWLWVMATREALMARRKRQRETPLTDFDLPIVETSLELNLLKSEYRGEFRLAFAEAMAELGAKERNLLRYHFVKRLTIDQIGAIYHVHRTTAFRWLRQARESLVSRTRKNVAARLGINLDEVDRMLHLVSSQLELSVERILGGA